MKSMHREKIFEEVIERNSETVYRLAYSLVRSQSDADDIYQEVFLRYVRKAPVFDSEEHEKAWFMRVTINCCKNFWKSPWIQRRSVLEKDVSEKESACETKDENQRLIDIVKRLPEKYRVVIHLFYYEELSIKEIAKITKSKASTVRTRLTRARGLLQRWLKEEGDDFHV